MLKQAKTEAEHMKQQFDTKCEGFVETLLQEVIVEEVYAVAFSAVSDAFEHQNQIFAQKFIESTITGMTQQVVLNSIIPESVQK